jgi:hypothetical protein
VPETTADPRGDSRKPVLDREGLDHLLTWVQDGVVSRRQILGLGGTDRDITRMLRRRDLVAVHPGVYVNHTGVLTREQQEWAAVLFYWPAALCHRSALPKPSRTGPIHLGVDKNRHRRRIEGVILHRIPEFDARVRWNLSPPRVSYEHAVITVAAAAEDDFAAFTVIADACQTRETTAGAIATALRPQRRIVRKALLLELLDDLAQGACSVLEREWLVLERRHGLPTLDTRQVPAKVGGRSAYRDVDHSRFGALIELDGLVFHDNATARDRDFDRDLDATVTSSLTTVRLTYGQVLRNGCRTVRKVATLLERGGWPGPFLRCPDCPADG